MSPTAERIRRRQHHIQFAQLIAYLMIIAMSIYVWSGFEQRDRDICSSAQKNRAATQRVVVAIYDLGNSLVAGDEGTVTPEQRATLAKFKKFKDEQLALLDEPVCPGLND